MTGICCTTRMGCLRKVRPQTEPSRKAFTRKALATND